jgi:hypothetical protein
MTTVLADLRELARPLSAFAAFQLGHFYLPSASSIRSFVNAHKISPPGHNIQWDCRIGPTSFYDLLNES